MLEVTSVSVHVNHESNRQGHRIRCGQHTLLTPNPVKASYSEGQRSSSTLVKDNFGGGPHPALTVAFDAGAFEPMTGTETLSSLSRTPVETEGKVQGILILAVAQMPHQTGLTVGCNLKQHANPKY